MLGASNFGQVAVGIGSSGSEFVDLGTGRTAVSVSLGGQHSCAILDDGSVKCWGRTIYGQTGHSMGSSVGSVDLGVGRTAVWLTLGGDYSCAILDNGELKCWGRLTSSQQSNSPTLIDFGAGSYPVGEVQKQFQYS